MQLQVLSHQLLRGLNDGQSLGESFTKAHPTRHGLSRPVVMDMMSGTRMRNKNSQVRDFFFFAREFGQLVDGLIPTDGGVDIEADSISCSKDGSGAQFFYAGDRHDDRQEKERTDNKRVKKVALMSDK